MSTNKFYANLFLGTRTQGVWTHPYSLAWTKRLETWGMAVSHIDSNQRAFGPLNTKIPGSPVQYFINPVGIHSIILSALELGQSTKLSLNALQAFSVNAVLSPDANSLSSITLPLVQGMGFVTARYKNLRPVIQSTVTFSTLVKASGPRPGIFKYRIPLNDGKTWLIYLVPDDGQDPELRLVSNSQIQGARSWSGNIQVSKVPVGTNDDSIYDGSAGVYPVSCVVSATTSASSGTYSLKWTKAGFQRGQPLLIFALPHHVQSFDTTTASRKTTLSLQTTTKGVATAISSDSWTLNESTLPSDMSFAPWTPASRTRSTLTTYSKNTIEQVAIAELAQDILAQTNLDSMYFSGKALSKFAGIVYTVKALLKQPALGSKGLDRLKEAFDRFASNKQIFPLVYDARWGGVVSSGAFRTGDPNQDFGNTLYNDHHFHYGTIVHQIKL